MRKALPTLATLLILLYMVSCSSDIDGIFARRRAFLRVEPVTAAPQLHTAANNPGMFCCVTFTSTHYVFTDADGHSSTIARTALESYGGKPECITGFIIGTPAIPDLNGNFVLSAYDLACPGCYEADFITRSLTFTGQTQASCSRCGRNYDLNNGGIASNVEPATRLFRYRISYSPMQNVLVVQN